MESKNCNSDSPFQENTSSLNYDVKGNDRHLAILYKKIEDLSSKVQELETKKILDETKLPKELLEQNGLLPQPIEKLKRGKGYRPLLQSEIEEAKKHSPFAAGQARWLRVSYFTYKKYAQLYGIFDPKPHEKGRRNLCDPDRGIFPLRKILAGEFNNVKSVNNWMVLDKLIRSKTFPARCNICGYDKRRIIDNKAALLLDHKNGDITDFNFENLQILCYNCTFECGRGYIRRGNHTYTFDTEVIAGRKKYIVDKTSRW